MTTSAKALYSESKVRYFATIIIGYSIVSALTTGILSFWMNPFFAIIISLALCFLFFLKTKAKIYFLTFYDKHVEKVFYYSKENVLYQYTDVEYIEDVQGPRMKSFSIVFKSTNETLICENTHALYLILAQLQQQHHFSFRRRSSQIQ